MRLNLKLDLRKLNGASLLNLKGKTATKKCIVIPVDDADLYVGEKGVYLKLSAYPHDDKHLLKQNFSKEFYNAMSDEERKATPILGDMEEWKTPEMKVEGSVEIAPGNDDDLPF